MSLLPPQSRTDLDATQYAIFPVNRCYEIQRLTAAFSLLSECFAARKTFSGLLNYSSPSVWIESIVFG